MSLGYTFQEYIEKLRVYLKDTEPYNILLSFREENSDDPELDLYVRMGISQINLIPPFSVLNYDTNSIQNCPAISLVIMESTWHALESNSIVQARNDLSYNNGGVTVKVEDAHRYIPAINELWRNLLYSREMFKMYKKTVNVGSLLGSTYGSGSHSPYEDLYRSRYVAH